MAKQGHVPAQRLHWLCRLLIPLVALSCSNDRTRQGIDVQLAGCTSLQFPGPRCALDDGARLHLWLAVSASANLELDGGDVIEQRTVQQGQRLLVDVLPEAEELRLLVDDGSEAWIWTLPVEHRKPAPWWTRTQELQSAGDSAAAETYLRTVLDSRDIPEDRGDQLYRLAGLVYRQGDSAQAQRLIVESMEWFQWARRPLQAVRSGTALSYWLHADDLWDEERQVLDALDDSPQRTDEGTLLLHFFQGQLALQTGDLRTARRRLRDAVRQAERLGLHRLRHQGEQLLATTLARAGRRDEAAQLFDRLGRDAAGLASDCEQGLFFNNVAWSRLLDLEAGHSADPLPALEQALPLVNDCATADAELANVYTNFALLYLHRQDPQRALDALRQARRLRPRPHRTLELLWQDIEGRLALARGAYDDALRHFAQERRSATEALIPEARWRAAVGTARTLWALQRRSEALDAFAQAETLLDSAALRVPIGDDRAAFVAQREWAACLHLEALLDADRPEDAMAVARRARSRVLRSLWRGQRLAYLPTEQRQRWDRAMARYSTSRNALEQALRDAWQLPADRLHEVEDRQRRLRSELENTLDQALQIFATADDTSYRWRSLDDGEVLLLFHPGSDGWWGLAEYSGEVSVKALGELTPHASAETLATTLLVPFGPWLGGASAVRILPYGELRNIDFHALPFAGEPLIVRRSVTYGLDLPTAEPHGASVDAALVVVDPNRDLPGTRQESRALHGTLGQGLDRVHWLQGPDAAGDAVRRLLPEVDLFHFAGHGDFDGWDSTLSLADDSRLSVGDIFALPRVPPRVILSGCETGRSGNDALYRLEDAAGIGAAFLTAGSREVIATQRPVDDDLAAELMAGLYPRWKADQSAAEALRQAQITRWRQDPDSDWASFRVLEP